MSLLFFEGEGGVSGMPLGKDQADLLGLLAHDVRTPLAGLLSLVDLVRADLIAGAKGAASLESYLDVLADGLESVLGRVSEVVDVSALDRAHLPLERSAIPARTLLVRAVGFAGVLARRRGVQLAIQADPRLVVHVDGQRLAAALRALVLGAVLGVRPGGFVNVSACEAGGALELAVEDSGGTIPAEAAMRCHDPFARDGDVSTFGVAKRLVEMHGGTVRIETEPGERSLFDCVIPGAAQLVEEAAAPDDSQTVCAA